MMIKIVYSATAIKKFAIPVRNQSCYVPYFRSRTVFGVGLLPWVARSDYLFSDDMAFVWDRLPRAIDV